LQFLSLTNLKIKDLLFKFESIFRYNNYTKHYKRQIVF